MEESDGVWSQEQHSNDSYRSEDHVQRHSNVKVESVIVDDANSEEHSDHDPIVPGGVGFSHFSAYRDQHSFYIFQDSLLYLKGIAVFFLPKLLSKMKPSNAMKRN